MKASQIFYLFITMLVVSCGETNKNNSNSKDYFSSKIDTSYNSIDRTKIDEITRHFYDKKSNNGVKSLTFSTPLKGSNDFMKFSLIKIDASDLKNAESSSLVFKSIEEVQDFFGKIDSLGTDKSLLERKKIKHYEINKGEYSVEIKQFDGEVNIPYKMELSISEYKGIKSAFEKYLLENQ